MKTNSELYGVGVEPLVIPQEVIDDRVSKLTARLEVLYSVHYMHRDNNTIRKVDKAKNFWENINKKEI